MRAPRGLRAPGLMRIRLWEQSRDPATAAQEVPPVRLRAAREARPVPAREGLERVQELARTVQQARPWASR